MSNETVVAIGPALVDEIEAKWEATTGGPWKSVIQGNNNLDEEITVDEYIEAIRNCSRLGGAKFWAVVRKERHEDGDWIVIGHIGNGPTSERNSEAISDAPVDIEKLIGEVRRQWEQNDGPSETIQMKEKEVSELRDAADMLLKNITITQQEDSPDHIRVLNIAHPGGVDRLQKALAAFDQVLDQSEMTE